MTAPEVPATTLPDDRHPEPAGPLFWVTAILGAAIVAFGLRGLLINEPRGSASTARWYVGGALVVDLIVIPSAAAVGWLVRRITPRRTWPVVRTALFTTAILTVFAAPLVFEQGGTPDNPTVRPRDYPAGLAVALALTWTVAAIGCAIVLLRRPSPTRRPRRT